MFIWRYKKKSFSQIPAHLLVVLPIQHLRASTDMTTLEGIRKPLIRYLHKPMWGNSWRWHDVWRSFKKLGGATVLLCNLAGALVRRWVKIWTTWCRPSAPGIAFDWAAADCQWSLSSHTVLLKAFFYCLECQGFVIAVSTDAWHWGLKNDGCWCFMHKLSLYFGLNNNNP